MISKRVGRVNYGDTFSLLLKGFAETGDLLSSKYLTSLIIQGTVGKEEA